MCVCVCVSVCMCVCGGGEGMELTNKYDYIRKVEERLTNMPALGR